MIGQGILSGFEARQPAYGPSGEWGTVGGFALREALSRGSLDAVMDVFDDLDAAGVADMLRESGFVVPPGIADLGKEGVLAHVQKDLIAAVEQRVDGFELRSARALAGQSPSVATAFAAKPGGAPSVSDGTALGAIQAVLNAPSVEVDLFGTAIPAERTSLQFIAGQAMDAGIQGFSFDGLPGKYKVPMGLQQALDLHGAAAAAIAVDTVRSAVGAWLQGGAVGLLPESVPGGVQRVLQGSLSEEGAAILVRALDEGTLAEHAREVGLHTVRGTLAAQGIDADAATVAQQAADMGLMVNPMASKKGKYAGLVVGMDHCSALVKYSRDQALVVRFSELGEGVAPPKLAQMARVEFNRDGKMTAAFTTVEQVAGTGIGR